MVFVLVALGLRLGGVSTLRASVVLLLVFVVLAVVLRVAADGAEDGQTGSSGCVRVDVNYVGSLDFLEETHRRVASVILHHQGVWLALSHVEGRVLEDAALPVGTLGRVVQKVLADGCHVLLAEALFLLKFFLPVGESTALLFELVLARQPVEPELAQLRLDLALPAVLGLAAVLADTLVLATLGSERVERRIELGLRSIVVRRSFGTGRHGRLRVTQRICGLLALGRGAEVARARGRVLVLEAFVAGLEGGLHAVARQGHRRHASEEFLLLWLAWRKARTLLQVVLRVLLRWGLRPILTRAAVLTEALGHEHLGVRGEVEIHSVNGV